MLLNAKYQRHPGRLKISNELLYLLGIVGLSLSMHLLKIADLGLSMIICPAYIISMAFPILSYGVAEYIVEGILVILFCMLMRKLKLIYLSSFLTGFLYATMADLWDLILFQHWNITFTSIEKGIFFLIGLCLSCLSLAMLYKTYFYPQIYDFFVKKISERYALSLKACKTCFDGVFLIISVILGQLLFQRVVGIGIGTIIMAICNGWLIHQFKMLFDQHFDCFHRFEKLALYFEGEGGDINGISS